MLFMAIVSFSLFVIQLVYIFASPARCIKDHFHEALLEYKFPEEREPSGKDQQEDHGTDKCIVGIHGSNHIYQYRPQQLRRALDENSRL